MTAKSFRPWDVDQQMLFPPSVKDFVSSDHLSQFIRDLVREDLDLSTIYARYVELRGYPPYHPAMMTALLPYSYSRGIYSSRRIEEACQERVDFMALTGLAKPDHSTICQFRVDHREALEGLFVQVLSLCREAGIAKLGHVALDGTKMKANASKHSAMSYKRMLEAEPELAKLVAEWMEVSRATDEAEDEEHGKDHRGDEIPDHVKAKLKKLVKIRAAKERLEAAAKEKAERLKKERKAKEEERGHKLGGVPPKALDGEPEEKAQSNFTDPESRIMKTKDGYEQAYNCQAAVDAEHQVIVAHSVGNRQNDCDELLPLVEQIMELTAAYPDQISADAGYCSEFNIGAMEDLDVDAYIATGRQKHGSSSPTGGEDKKKGPLAQKMRAKLKEGGFEGPYRLRKQVVEPVFGQIKQARGFRQFLYRGLERVSAEWSMICTAHNLLKLFASRTPNTQKA
jgi:transposase